MKAAPALLLLFLLAASPAHAGGRVDLTFGAGTSGGTYLAASYSLPRLPSYAVVRPTVGTFNGGNFFSSPATFFVAVPVGLRAATPSGAYAEVFVGPAVVTREDDRLGGYFQTLLGADVGLEGEHTLVGMAFRHLSNGGLNHVNTGRNYIGLFGGLKF